MKLSVIVLAKNESRHIRACLASAAGADELLVIDDFSDDDTASLALAAGAVVAQHRLADFSAQRNFALGRATGDWVFFLDADERFSPELMAAVKRHLAESPQAAGSVVRKNFAFGRRHRFGPLKPDRVTRLFPRPAVRWEGEVHERPVTDLPVRPLAGHLVHLTYHSWAQYLEKQHRYARIWAEQAAARGRTSTPLKAFFRGVAGFLKMFILNLGFLGGPSAWALCWHHGGYTLAKYLRLIKTPAKPAE